MILPGLALDGVRVLVAGGGPDAATAATELVERGAVVSLVAEVVCDAVPAKVGVRVGRPAVEDLAGAALVVVRGPAGPLPEAAAAQGVPCLGAVTRPAHDGPGRVALVGGGPGAPGLLTRRGHELLLEADVVVVDRLAPRSVLDELDPDVEVVDAGKVPGCAGMTQDEIEQVLVDRALAGLRVVRLKGGDPHVFGRGGEELARVTGEGIACEVVPGVSSVLAAPASAGVGLTHRGVTPTFTVVSAHTEPGAPEGYVDWPAIARVGGTLVVLMAVGRLGEVTGHLVDGGRSAETPALVVERATLPEQRTVSGTLADIAARCAEACIAPPAVLVVGEVVGL